MNPSFERSPKRKKKWIDAGLSPELVDEMLDFEGRGQHYTREILERNIDGPLHLTEEAHEAILKRLVDNALNEGEDVDPTQFSDLELRHGLAQAIRDLIDDHDERLRGAGMGEPRSSSDARSYAALSALIAMLRQDIEKERELATNPNASDDSLRAQLFAAVLGNDNPDPADVRKMNAMLALERARHSAIVGEEDF